MKRLLFLLGLLPAVAWGQPFPPNASLFSRQALTNTTAAGWRTKLGIVSTNVSIGATNIFTTNTSNALITNQVRSMAVSVTNGIGTNNTFWQPTNYWTSGRQEPQWVDGGGPADLNRGVQLWDNSQGSNTTMLNLDYKDNTTIMYWGDNSIVAHSFRTAGAQPNVRWTFPVLNASGDEQYRGWKLHTNDFSFYYGDSFHGHIWALNDNDALTFGSTNGPTTLAGTNVTIGHLAAGTNYFTGTNVGDFASATNLNGTEIRSGTVAADRLGSSGGAGKFLRYDNTWQTVAGGAGSASNAIASISTNGVLISSSVLTNIDLTNGANILISGVENTGTGIVTIAVSPTPTFSSITTTGTGPNILYSDQYQTNALIVTTGQLIWSNSPAGNGITNINGNTTNSGTIAASQFVGGGAGLTGVTAAPSPEAITNNETRTFNLAGSGVQVTGGGGYYGANSTNVEWMSAANATVGTKLYGNEAYFAGPVYMATGQWLSTSNVSTGVLDVGDAATFRSTLEVSNMTAVGSITNGGVGGTKVVITDANGKETGATLSGLTLVGTTLTATASGGGGTNSGPIALTFSDTNVAVNCTTPAGCVTNAPLHYRLTMTTNALVQNPTGMGDGQRIVIEFINDAVGDYTVYYDTTFAFGTDITGTTLSTADNKHDFATFIYNSATTKWYCVGFVRGY